MCYNRNIFLGTEDKVMEKSKVYFTDFRTRLGEGLPSKLKRLMKAAGIQDMDMDHKFVAIKMHFGELGNLGYLRPNYAKAVADVVKELGGKHVISKANREIHAKFLLRNGADEVIYPDRDIAEKLAVRYSADHVFDYIELSDEYSIYEIPPLTQWVGKSLKESGIRNSYHINILGTKTDGKTNLMPSADYVIRAEDHLLAIGRKQDIEKILKVMK